MNLYEVKYLGSCKDKGRGSQAFGWVNGSWSLIFPEQVLRAWFDDAGLPGEQSSLYAVLGMKQEDVDVKGPYRRMVMQWHPDRCKEPGANEQFLRIQEAYNILSNPIKRARYNAGLKMMASVKPVRQEVTTLGYRAPLKCGYVMVDGTQSGKWFVVKAILAWEDIIQDGRVLASSWPAGSQQPVEVWL